MSGIGSEDEALLAHRQQVVAHQPQHALAIGHHSPMS